MKVICQYSDNDLLPDVSRQETEYIRTKLTNQIPAMDPSFTPLRQSRFTIKCTASANPPLARTNNAGKEDDNAATPNTASSRKSRRERFRSKISDNSRQQQQANQ